jgi:2-methylcitrate dehydratase
LAQIAGLSLGLADSSPELRGITVAIDLRAKHKLDPKAIKRIRVEVAQGAYDVLAGGTYDPKKECRIKEQADHNLMYLVSVALLDDEIWPEQFTTERINRSDVQDLMKKVTASPNAFSRRIGPEMPASITIELENGETIRGEKAVFDGFYSTPMSWDQVRAKFDRLTDGKLDKGLGREISTAAAEIDTVALKHLTALLGRVSPA